MNYKGLDFITHVSEVEISSFFLAAVEEKSCSDQVTDPGDQAPPNSNLSLSHNINSIDRFFCGSYSCKSWEIDMTVCSVIIIHQVPCLMEKTKIVQEVKHFIKLPPFVGNQIAFENFALVSI